MQFSKLTAPSLKELFIQELEGRILSGQLTVGEQLPTERDLAEQMQVSRSVVNSGIADLARKGFLVVKPRSGVIVADYRRHGTAEAMLSIMRYNGGNLRTEDARSILEVKLAVDKLAVSLAIPQITQDDIMLLHSYLLKLKETSQPKETAAAAYDFYQELSILSGNTMLPLLYSSFRVPNMSLWERFAQTYSSTATYEKAENLFRAIAARDLRGAVAAIEENMRDIISGERKL